MQVLISFALSEVASVLHVFMIVQLDFYCYFFLYNWKIFLPTLFTSLFLILLRILIDSIRVCGFDKLRYTAVRC